MDHNRFDNTENVTPQIREITPFENKIRKMLSSSAFLTATIAQTVVASISVVMRSINVFSILFTIGMWLIYVAAKKEAPIKGLKFISGTLKAYYIVAIIGIVFLIIVGIVLLIVSSAVFKIDDTSVVNIITDALTDIGPIYGVTDGEIADIINNDTGLSISTLLCIICVALGVAFIICAIFAIVVNELFIKRFNKQIKTAIDALLIGDNTELKLGGIRGWLIFFGVMASISAVSGFFSFYSIFSVASSAASAVTMFALNVAINEKNEKSQGQIPESEQPLL